MTDIETTIREFGAAVKNDPDAIRNNHRLSPRTRELLAELYEDYEAEEVPEIVAYLVRAADALKHLPADFDPMGLSLRDHDAIIGDGPMPDEIPGVPAGFADMPLRELQKVIGPHEFRHSVLEWGEKIEAEHRAFMHAANAAF